MNDFDVSPTFKVNKPTIEAGFDFYALRWPQETAQRNPIIS